MKFVALISGGKDSFYSIIQATKHGHELVCCAHLSPPKSVLESNSFMYQSAGSNVIPYLTEECLGVPLVVRECQGTSVNTSLAYERKENENDEVEDLFELLKEVLQKYPDVQGVCNGAILSNYQRLRVENVCSRLILTPLSYLWRIGPQEDLLQCMLEDGIEAVLIKTAAPGLLPRKHLNKTLATLHYSGLFDRLKSKFDFHVCGEGGEYETLMLDCPIFKKKLVLDDVEIVYPDGNEDGDIYEGVVGLLKINSFHVIEKNIEAGDIANEKKSFLSERIVSQEDSVKMIETNIVSNTNNDLIYTQAQFLPTTKHLPGGLFHVSEMLDPSPEITPQNSAQAAVQETLQIFKILKATLDLYNCKPQDVIYVHLYLAQISHFALINSHYLSFFGSFLPPSRSCVSVGEHVLPRGRNVMMDVCVQSQSGAYMRSSSNNDKCSFSSSLNAEQNKLREVLHVQGLSYWAPICVGPYSQANTIRGGLIMMAGQIGLSPPTMSLVNRQSEDGQTQICWERQLDQCWKNAASVFDALKGGGNLTDSMGILVYLSSDLWKNCDNDSTEIWNKARNICRESLSKNGGVVAGYIDERKETTEDFGGYEDEETYREMEQRSSFDDEISNKSVRTMIPITIIAIPQMPVGALAEIEIVGGTSKAISCLGIESNSIEDTIVETADTDVYYGKASVTWNCGYDNVHTKFDTMLPMKVSSHVRYIPGCCAMAWVSASPKDSSEMRATVSSTNLEVVLSEVMYQIIQCAEMAGMNMDHILHIRLYYVAKSSKDNGATQFNDGLLLRSALSAEINSWFGVRKTNANRRMNSNVPAFTVVPVHGLESGIFSAQVMINDLVHMETDLWVHHGRKDLY